MTGNEILIVLALLGLGVAGFVVLRKRPPALPPAPAPKGAVPSPARDAAIDDGDEAEAISAAASEAKRLPAAREAEAASEAEGPASTEAEGPASAEAEGIASAEAEGIASAEAEGIASAEAEGPSSGAETIEDGPREASAAAPTPTAAPTPAAPRKPFFTPPPMPGARAAVPLPVDKPKLATTVDADEAARRERERERYRQGLAKTRGGFVAKLARLFKGRPKVDAGLRERVEEVLLTADIGTTTAETLLAKVTKVLDAKEVADPDAVWSVIRQAMLELLEIDAPPPSDPPASGPYVLLVIGVNGVGKTTTLGKLAAQHQRAGRKVLLVAGDTFRAAATEQLDVWARRVGCQIHMGADKADPSSVIFEGITRGRREGFDVVLCDTAGRLHTRKELMDELAKVGRAAGKALGKDATVHDTFLVLDATIGQNALAQAQLFKETMGLTGLVITKLDGTAKGGVVLGVCDELRVPIRYVGIGEGIDDLRAFDAEGFVDALLADRERLDGTEPGSP